ncbi:MAG: hypothetical protein QOH89_3293 [Pseudonocardiales bacterium]|nr:hypothetical protein [Pseudonocardiales bacterium]
MSPAVSRGTWVKLGVAAVIVAGAVTAVLLATGGDDSPAPTPTPTFVTGPGLDSGGINLATLLTNARNHTFHAHYTVRGNPKLLGGTLELEWWNTPGHSRIDTTRTTGGGDVVKTASIIDGDTGIGCEKDGAAAWTCHPVEVTAPGDPSGMISTLKGQLSGRTVAEHAGKVTGISARCFHVGGGAGDPLDVCTNSDGVMLRNATADVAYQITSLDDNVPDSVFDPPATVSK